MGRRGLPGGYTEVQISTGQELLDRVDAACTALGKGWNRSKFTRAAWAALLDQLDRDGELVTEDDPDVDPDDAADGEGTGTAAAYLGPTLHPPRCMGGGRWPRWVARFPADYTEAQAVDAMRAKVPGAVVKLHRQAHQLLAWTDSPERWEQDQLDGVEPAPWVQVHPPGA